MIHYRLVKITDWPEICQLVQRVFQEQIPMERSFPLLFNPSNTFSYVAVDDQTIIGFIGVLPEELRSGTISYYGSRIGAVCTSPDYQGQGIGRSLFRVMKAEANVDFILVSGQGKLYLQEGCELFGEFEQFVIPPAANQVVIQEYQGWLTELSGIHQLLQQADSYFNKSPMALQQLITAQALGNLWSGKQTVYLAYEKEQIRGCLVTVSRQEEELDITEVIEAGGDSDLVVAMAQQLAVQLPQLTIRAAKNSELANSLKQVARGESVQNAGTILYLNPKIKEVAVPHTWDLAFL